MIIIKLQGGLGNQLFQYSAARALSEKNNTKLLFDLSLLKPGVPGITERHFALSVFNIKIAFANAKEIEKISSPVKMRRLLQKVGLAKKRIYNEPHFNFDAAFFKLTSNSIVTGYMQSEKYFKAYRKLLLNDLKITAPLSDKTNLLFESLKKANSVSVHIRRGDFVSDPKTKGVHGICDLIYYENAISIIAAKVGYISLYVFSDDVEWTRQNFKAPYPIIFSDHTNEKNAYEDMWLMSACKHNIIANSSFSWWGAWLNLNPEKIVVAPAKWFNNSTADIKDLIPPEWIKI